MRPITIGMPRMHLEEGEKRDFLPAFVLDLLLHNAQVVLEHGYGSGMGLKESDYPVKYPSLKFASMEETYQQDIVLVLRYPGDEPIRRMRPGSCLVSMLHYPTRPLRVDFLRSRGIEAISLDSIKDDLGKRLVENLRAVAWNGVDIAFQTLRGHYPPPGIEDPARFPIKVTVMGAGAVGGYAIQAAVRYGNVDYWKTLAAKEVTGVQVTVVEYDLTNHTEVMTQILKYTDILVDATQRPDPSKPVIPNEWIALMRPHAVLLDLSVDPYDGSLGNIRSAKGIEGIPQGNLDQYVFEPHDPAYNAIPSWVNAVHRRYAVSCYSWPGIKPLECMEVYGMQLKPVFNTILSNGGVKILNHKGNFFHRALSRALLSRWVS
ncbi:MAG: alanine dehydrogenase [Anaerolineaceae bacterium]|nr:alanine dehydrogenase [Anaerolineaceae bacterium]